ncbi:MAG: PH domain-containing protein [Salinibacterium sp.]|nr:PH domain-containing protein [Salinibacterium sp.]
MTDERVVARLRPHARALFWPTLVLLAVAAGVGFLSGTFREQWQNTALLSVAGALVLLGWLVPLLRWSSRNYTITTRRVVVSSGLIARSRHEVLLLKISDITVERRGLQSVFRSGDVVVNDTIVLADVPSAALVQAAIHDLVESTARAARSL